MPESSTTAVAGGEHSLVRDPTGRLFSAGGCGLGWCRLEELAPSLMEWRPVPIPEAVSSIYHAGYYHNLAVGQQTGKLYSWGCGTFASQDDTAQTLDGIIPALGPNATTDRGEAPRPVPIPDERIVGVSGGAYHSIVWCKPSGTLYTFGAGQLGQLGRRLGANTVDGSNLPVDPQPKPVEGLNPNDPIVSIGSGFYKVCQSKSLYCAGENQNQQCGQGPRNLHTMTKVNEVKDVDQVAGGYCHTLIRDTYGKVFSMGCGEDGQRGDGLSDEDDSRPVVTPVSLPTAAKQVAAGANHSVVLGTNGVAYTFGANDVGQCGIENELEPVYTPQAVTAAEPIVQVSTGYAHTVLTTVSGRVLVFGQNDNGQLGLGSDSNTESQTQPVQSNISPPVF